MLGHLLDRRGFLQTGAAAAAAAAMAGQRLVQAAPGGPTVVIIRDKTKKVIADNTVDAALVQNLVDQAVMKLSGKDDVAKAWGAYVGAKDKVAVKFNGLFARATTHPEVVAAVTSSLIKAGVDPANIVVYDRDDRAFTTARVKVNRDGDAPRAYPTVKDLGPKVKAGPVDTQLSKILLDADVLINVPIMKTHVLAGVTGALKNHLGTVPNANQFHRDGCQYVADISALEPIKAKTRLCICDALYGLFDKGPQFNPAGRWDYYGIVASVDPVAMDATLADIIKAKRVEKGLAPYHKDIKHVLRAAELGIGVADLAKINRVEAEV
ncbi:MAG TPA: DUF362 domain-containing protein [Planctomycetota bacterium]|nr:DUF362 domain-containing protein [Planctomycetota bacterium]